jgi:hypothetical protein
MVQVPYGTGAILKLLTRSDPMCLCPEGVKYVFLGLRRQLRCQAEGKNGMGAMVTPPEVPDSKIKTSIF